MGLGSSLAHRWGCVQAGGGEKVPATLCGRVSKMVSVFPSTRTLRVPDEVVFPKAKATWGDAYTAEGSKKMPGTPQNGVENR